MKIKIFSAILLITLNIQFTHLTYAKCITAATSNKLQLPPPPPHPPPPHIHLSNPFRGHHRRAPVRHRRYRPAPRSRGRRLPPPPPKP